MAYPIASLPGGGVLYSDGSKRYPAMQSVQPNMSTPYGPARQTSQGLMVTQPGGVTQRVETPPQTSGGSLSADVLRSKFGFNDPNVINSILNNPSERARYEAELNKAGGPNRSLAPLTKPSAPMSTPSSPISYSDKVNTVKDSNTSFADKLLSLVQNNTLVGMADKTNDPFLFLGPKQNPIRQVLGDATDALSKFGFEQIRTGLGLNPDAGISEMIAGGPTKNTAMASSGRNENLLSGSDSNQVIRQSKPDLQSNPTTDKFKLDLQNLDKSIKKDVNNFKATDVLGASTGNDAWALVDETYNQVNDLYMQGAISEEEAQKRIRDAELLALDQQFNKLNANYDQLIPEYNTSADNAIEDINTNLTRAKESGQEQSTNIDNTYSSALRKAVKNAQQLTNQRRNIFSNLNTAESSAFLDAQTLADTELGRDLNTTEREKASKIGAINKTLADYEKDANTEIARIKQDRDAKIQKVNESKRLSEADKSVERGKILAEYEVGLSDIQKSLNENRIAQIAGKQNFADQLALITAQGNVDQGLLNTQANIAKQAGTLAQQIPFELDSELKGFLKAPYSSPTKANQLKSLYPQWADLIDGVMGGQINLQDYVAQTGGASNLLG